MPSFKTLIKKRKKNPKFLRQDYGKRKRIKKKWKNPSGLHSKMKKKKKGKRKPVEIGYRTPKKTRGIHPSGFIEVYVQNINDLKGIDKKKCAIRIGRVGKKKRIEILKEAKKLKIKVLNPGKLGEQIGVVK